MTATKRKLLYSLVALLFLLVFALIGWLVHVLFAFRITPPKPVPVAGVPVQRYVPGAGPLSETVIYAEAQPEMSGQRTGEGSPGVAVAVDASGLIPCICEGGGAELRRRDAFNNPVTHQTVFTATRAVVTLTLPPDAPRGEQ